MITPPPPLPSPAFAAPPDLPPTLSPSQAELELNFETWRDYQANKSLSATKRRMYLACWLNEVWGLLQTQEDFIEKCFSATVLVNKMGEHVLRMRRIRRAYTPQLT